MYFPEKLIEFIKKKAKIKILAVLLLYYLNLYFYKQNLLLNFKPHYFFTNIQNFTFKLNNFIYNNLLNKGH